MDRASKEASKGRQIESLITDQADKPHIAMTAYALLINNHRSTCGATI
jgi:hypothetical protein